jgi:hypothetical protein
MEVSSISANEQTGRKVIGHAAPRVAVFAAAVGVVGYQRLFTSNQQVPAAANLQKGYKPIRPLSTCSHETKHPPLPKQDPAQYMISRKENPISVICHIAARI